MGSLRLAGIMAGLDEGQELFQQIKEKCILLTLLATAPTITAALTFELSDLSIS